MTLLAQQDESVEVVTGRSCRMRRDSVRQMASQASLDAVRSVVGEHTIQLAAHDEAIACIEDGLQATNAKCDSVDIAVAVLQRDNRVLKSKFDFCQRHCRATSSINTGKCMSWVRLVSGRQPACLKIPHWRMRYVLALPHPHRNCCRWRSTLQRALSSEHASRW